MKPFILLSALLPLAFSAGTCDQKGLDPTEPIYLGEVFWPPTMTFFAWQPSEENDWCYRGIDASDERHFSLGGIDGLQIHDYFSTQAYLTRNGERFANCAITPESIRLNSCDELQRDHCVGGQRIMGTGTTRRWSCWVTAEGWMPKKTSPFGGNPPGEEERLTDSTATPTKDAKKAAVSSSNVGAFTAGVTGR